MKIHACITSICLLLALTAASQTVYSAQGSLASCQTIKDKIDYYTRLRRAGGAGKTMERWKQRRDKYKDKYSEKRCSKWRNDLK